MSIKRISELDYFNIGKFAYECGINPEKNDFIYVPDDTNKRKLKYPEIQAQLSNWVLFEISLSCNENNEEPSYYLSKKINGGELYHLLVGDIYKELSTVTLINNGYLLLGEPNEESVDYVDHYRYDKRTDSIELLRVNEDGIIERDDEGNPIYDEYPRLLCCMIPSYFSNKTEHHAITEFHNEIVQKAGETDPKEIVSFTKTCAKFDLTGGSHSNPNFHVTGYPRFDCAIDGVAMSAWWADLAEMYKSDERYSPGTLVKFGGAKEITIATDKANGVVTTSPGFVLNSSSDTEGEIMLGLTLAGRVPVKVVGPVNKFDRIVMSKVPGCGKVGSRHPIGIALESNSNPDEKLVECCVLANLN